MTLVASVFVGGPSPKYQLRFVMVPVDRSVRVTVKGTSPLVGVAVKPACGSSAPIPDTIFVLLPALEVRITTVFVNAAAFVVVKLITRLVDPKLGRRKKGVPDTIANGPPVTVAVPLEMAAPPRFVTAKLACTLWPAVTSAIPKSSTPGRTPSC